MAGSTEDEWHVLCDRMSLSAHRDSNTAGHAGLSFACFTAPIESDITSNSLHQQYLSLLKRAYIAVQENKSSTDVTTDKLLQVVRSTFSYNLAMTCDIMAILPRRNESASLPEMADSLISINGTILAGTLMVKSEQEFEAMKKDPTLLDYILKEITFPGPQVTTKQNIASKY